jgi:hypothetical protein
VRQPHLPPRPRGHARRHAKLSRGRPAERTSDVTDAFDRFRDETGISDERAQELLWLLYDYQEAFRAIDAEYESGKPFRDDEERDLYLRRHGSEWRMLAIDTGRKLRDLLEADELRAWRTFERAGFWILLREPLIQPVEP